ncbi:hypothetical protein BC834DRAFT_923708 [Gloeopeniophorella convolvens]|nr:hypothetical protein BC834DRAFT_923708 [Gloeopeniophorella convolvens]
MPPKPRAPCQICSAHESKYACAACRAVYCSAPCYKQHKGAAAAPLAALKWPYVPEASAFPDPLQRDDPKPLSLAQYEAIATAPGVRAALRAHPELRALLVRLDGLRGAAREEALEAALGVSRGDEAGSGSGSGGGEEREGMRALAGAIEGAVRGGSGGLGLDWIGARENDDDK